MKKQFAILLSLALSISSIAPSAPEANAASKKMKISKKSVTMKVGQTLKIKIKNAGKKKVTWKSSKKKIAKISKKGVITALKKGTAKITAKVGKKKFTCVVKVKSKKKTTNKTTPTPENQVKNTPTPSPTPQPTETPHKITYTYTDEMSDGDVYFAPYETYNVRFDNITYGRNERIQYYSTTTKKNRFATIILPPNYDKSKKYPVCYLLHGLGADDRDWIGGKAIEIIGNLIYSGDAEDMILVLPNCRARENDAANPSDAFSLSNYQAFDNFINDLRDNLMPYIKSHYSIKEGRTNTAIAGFSMGGRTALYIGLKMQDTFGYVGGFCPAPGIFKYTANGVSEDGLFTAETFALEEKYKDNALLMIVAGKRDSIVGDIPKGYHEALVANGTPHMWITSNAGNHDINMMGFGFYNFAKLLFH